MNIFTSLQGVVTVSLTGADVTGTLDVLTNQGIQILHCTIKTELEAVLTVPRSQFGNMKNICKKRGDSLKLQSRGGIYWTMKAFIRRPVLTIGGILYILAALYLPTRVFFVRVEGNREVPVQMILEAAERCGVGFGASRRGVRSERVKNALLEEVPELQWAGVNTYGCVAEISVREREKEDEKAPESAFGHIVACRDGVILSCDAIRGNLICVAGQAVSAGDILISGYTDCGLSIRAEQAQGEVFAATAREITIVTPDSCRKTEKTGEKSKKISLLIGKKRINFWKDSGIWDTTCDRMYEEYYITLPGGFQLPFGWSVERYTARDTEIASVNLESAQLLLAEAAQALLKAQMLSGTIRDSEASYTENPGRIQMTGQYSCVEMIGIMQRLQIGETNGENN